MKSSYKAYKINSSVWAISAYYKDGKPTTYVAIFPARVKSVYFDYNAKTDQIDCSYWLLTPDGQEWGEEVFANEVSDEFDVLAQKMKQIWADSANEM